MAASAIATPRRRPRPGDGRTWTAVAAMAVPDEPGRAVVIACVQTVRRARGRRTRGDDRLETDAYAVKRYLWRLAHAQRSGRFACSVDQLVAGLAPIMRWGPVPPRGSAQRTRFFRRHRASVQRWLDWLQAGGLISVCGQQDEHGYWWRTVIELHASPAPPREDLQAARARMEGWARREAQRRARLRPPKRSLQAIRRSSHRPNRRTRRRLALRSALQAHEVRRRRVAEATIAQVYERREACCGDLRHPFGAPPSSALSISTSETSKTDSTSAAELPADLSTVHTPRRYAASVDKTGACARENRSNGAQNTTESDKECTEKGGAPALPAEQWAKVVERVAARERELAPLRAIQQAQLLERARVVALCPAGKACGWGRLREAWGVFRFGAAQIADAGAPTGGTRSHALEKQADAAIALYGTFAAQRPPGWPPAGTGALCVLGAQRRANSLAGDITRLLVLAKDMRALAVADDAERLKRARTRAQGRHSATAAPHLTFRAPDDQWTKRLRDHPDPQVQRTARRLLRNHLRDDLLRDGEHPGDSTASWQAREREDLHDHPTLDGLSDRAVRYRQELNNGLWALPRDWPW